MQQVMQIAGFQELGVMCQELGIAGMRHLF